MVGGSARALDFPVSLLCSFSLTLYSTKIDKKTAIRRRDTWLLVVVSFFKFKLNDAKEGFVGMCGRGRFGHGIILKS